ncbi:MAG: flagellar hook basal-body protein [Myxococcales bacterium]|nr:flagellar hook basal-body protein [Myxococcales bacterium]
MRDLYVALSGASAAWDGMSGIAQNLANSKTQGYREQRTSFELVGPPGGELYAGVGQVIYSTADGPLELDQVPTHLALRGDGFFALEDGTYTRDGSFRIDGERRLVTGDGVPVLGDRGAIQLEPGETFTVGPDGTLTASLTASTSRVLGAVKIVSLRQAEALGGNRWGGIEGEPLPETTIVQGAVEGSNADIMRGMIEMMEASHFFEAQQKAIQASDETRARLNRIGGS